MPEKSTNGRADVGRQTDLGIPPMMLPFGLEALIEFNRPALSMVAQLNGKMYDGIAAMNRHWVDFVNRRLKEDLSVPRQLAACKTVQDMYGVYTEFFQTAYADYQSEFEEMTKLGKSLADDAMQVVQARVEEAAREVRPAS